MLLNDILFPDGCVIVIGGMSIDTNPKDYMMSYDLKEDRWQTLPPMPTPRYATFAFIINDKLYVIGEYRIVKVYVCI